MPVFIFGKTLALIESFPARRGAENDVAVSELRH